MVEELILFYIVNILFDYVNLSDLRILVYSFLLSKRNIKSAKKIHKEQTAWDRFTLSYVNDYAVYKRQFKVFQRFLSIYQYVVIPHYLVFIIANSFSGILASVLLIASAVIKIITLCIIRHYFWRNSITIFDKRYAEK